MTITLRSFEEVAAFSLTEVNEFGYTPDAWAALGPRARHRIRHKEKIRDKRREYNQRPDVKATRKEAKRQYRQTEEGKAAHVAEVQRYTRRRRDAREATKAEERARRQALAPQWRIENRAAIEADPRGMLRRIYKAIKPSWTRDVRDDVAQDIAVALLDGQLPLSEIEKTAAEFVRSHFSGRDWFETYDLDMKLPNSTELTLADVLSTADVWH